MELITDTLVEQRKASKVVLATSDATVATLNKAFETARNDLADLIILAPGIDINDSIQNELISVAYTDPMIGFVSARTGPNLSAHLPTYVLLPAAPLLCLFIKSKIICELGAIDSVYESINAAMQDFFMRANRLGYRIALANKAYVSEQITNMIPDLNSHDRRILYKRYQEYPFVINSYLNSPEYRAELLLLALVPDKGGHLTIGFDFSQLSSNHNGTNEAGIKLIQAADTVWPKHFKMIVYCSQQAWEYHGFSQCFSKRVSLGSLSHKSHKIAAMIKLGQPFSPVYLKNATFKAPINAYLMQDSIATDCEYLKQFFDENIWRFIFKWADVVFTVSDYSASQFKKRYSIGEHVLLCSSLLSVTPDEYYLSVDTNYKSTSNKSILIVGNKFAHKGLPQYVKGLATHFPDITFYVLGDSNYGLSNVVHRKSGHLSMHEVASLYHSVDAVIFPSHYEGFGFPFLNSLAYQKPIFLRDMPPYYEIMNKIKSGKENVHLFSSMDHLIQLLQHGIPKWIGDEAVGESAGWNRSALDLLHVLEMKINTIQVHQIAERMRWFELVYTVNVRALFARAHYKIKDRFKRLWIRIKEFS